MHPTLVLVVVKFQLLHHPWIRKEKKRKKKEIFIEFSKMKGFININQVHVSFQGNVLVQGFYSFHSLLFVSRSLNGLMFQWLYVSMSPCFIISIHSKDIHPQITSSFCRFLCLCIILLTCVTFSLVVLFPCFTFLDYF